MVAAFTYCLFCCLLIDTFVIIEDCKDAQDELFKEIDEAKAFLSKKGMKFD